MNNPKFFPILRLWDPALHKIIAQNQYDSQASTENNTGLILK